MTLKCTADAGQFYRQVYPGVVVGGVSLSACAAAVLEHGLSGYIS